MIPPPQRLLYLHFLFKSYEYIVNDVNQIQNIFPNLPNVLHLPQPNMHMMLNQLNIMLHMMALLSTVRKRKKNRLVRPQFLIRLLRGYRLVFYHRRTFFGYGI